MIVTDNQIETTENSPKTKPRLLVLVGPTAVGKTKLSIAIAKAYDCEILSGDSMQIYRGMDIGTAKITKEEMGSIPHHLVDIHNPDYPFSVAEFQREAQQVIIDISNRGKLPFLVGGTGLYVEALCYGFSFTDGGADEQLRRDMRQFLDTFGEQALHNKLREIDPSMADRLHPNDHRRVIRAIEIAHLTGTTMSEQLASQKKESPYTLCLIGLTMDRQILYNRIEARIDLMMEQGLVQEVHSLLEQGFDSQYTSMQGLGYKEIAAAIQGQISMNEAVRLLKQNTRRFAKRQLSWFRRMKDIHWINIDQFSNDDDLFANIHCLVAGKFTTEREYI